MLTRKVLLPIMFTIVVFVVATITACNKSSTPELPDYWIDNVDEMVNTYNSSVRFEQFRGFNKKGEVDMYKSVDRDGEEIFVILFATPDFEKNKVFGLQSQESIELPDGIPEHLSSAQVVYLGDFLLINDLNSSFKAKFSVKRSSPEIFEQLKFNLEPRIFGLSITSSAK